MRKPNPLRQRHIAAHRPRCVACGQRITPTQAFKFPVCKACQRRAEAVQKVEVQHVR